jgi:hypothetical protein
MINIGRLRWDSHPPPLRGSSLNNNDLKALQRQVTCLDHFKDQSHDLLLLGTSRGIIFILNFSSISLNSFNGICSIERIINPPYKEKSLHVQITILKLSPCSRYLAVGLINGLVLIFQLNNLENLQIIYQHSEHKGSQITALCWSIDSCKLFSGCQRGLLIELNLAENPAIDVMAFAASLFGITNTLRIGECRAAITSIDYYFSPKESSLKGGPIDSPPPPHPPPPSTAPSTAPSANLHFLSPNPTTATATATAMFTSLLSSASLSSSSVQPSPSLPSSLPSLTSFTSWTSGLSSELSSGDNLLVTCSDKRVLQFRLVRDGTKQAKMILLNQFIQRVSSSESDSGQEGGPTLRFSYGSYVPRNRFPSLLTSPPSLQPSFTVNSSSSLILLCSDNSPEIFVCDFFQNSVSRVSLLHESDAPQRSISFIKLFLPSTPGPSDSAYVLTSCSRLGFIDFHSKTFRLLNGLTNISSLIKTPSALIYLCGQPHPKSGIGVVCAASQLASCWNSTCLLPRSIHRHFSLLKEQWRHHRHPKSLDQHSPMRAPRVTAPHSTSPLSRRGYKLPSSSSKLLCPPTFHSLELLLQQSLNECDQFLEKINLDALDALHLPTLTDIESTTPDHRRQFHLSAAMSPSLRSPNVNYDHTKHLMTPLADSNRPSFGDESTLETHSYAVQSLDQSMRLISVSDHYDIVTLSKKMFFKDFIQLLDSSSSSTTSGTQRSQQLWGMFRDRVGLKDERVADGGNDSWSRSDEKEGSELSSLCQEVDELCLLSAFFTKTIDEEVYDTHCKFIQPNQMIVQHDLELLASFQPPPPRMTHHSQILQEAENLIQKTNQLLGRDSRSLQSPERPFRRWRSYSVGTPRQSPSSRVNNDPISLWLSPIRQIGDEGKSALGEGGEEDHQGGLSQQSNLLCESGSTSREEDRETPLLSSPVVMESDILEDTDPEPDHDPDWIRETTETWLDQWQECPPASTLHQFKLRLKTKRFSRHLFSHQPPVITSTEDSLDPTLPPPEVRETYEVNLKCGPHGLGLSLNMNSESLLMVTGFNLMPLGVQNPARACRLISKGDLLVRINDVSLVGFEPNETIDVLRTFLSSRANVSFHPTPSTASSLL